MRILASITVWILNLSWGAIMSLPGLFILAWAWMTKKVIHKNGCSVIIVINGNWGGLNLGIISLCGNYDETDPDYYEHVRRHEFGHCLQNAVFGPFQLILVSIPSVIRYWYRRANASKITTAYDDIWFEGTATAFGTKFINWFEK